jgi:hypothetical protein
MAYRVFRTFFAGVGLAGAALMVPADMASARSAGVVVAAHGGFASAHAMVRPHGVGGFRHRSRFGGVFPYWPGYDDGDRAVGEPVGAAPPQSNDVHYTYTYDVPWDWAHRYPPNVMPSDRPYVSSCPTESVTVPGSGGDHTVNITRCY